MFFSKGLDNEFEIAVVTESSVFEPLKFYCTYFSESGLDEPSSIDDTLDLRDPGYDISGYNPELEEILEKRLPVLGLDKRYSLMRFGKRGSLMRFGKRGSLMRFGKKSGYADDDSDDFSLDYPYYTGAEYDPYQARKRGTLMRFGKKSSLMRFGRSADRDKKPHTPWRFGREEEDLLF